MTDPSTAPDEPPYVRPDEPVAVVVTSERGSFDGLVLAWKGERVYARWTEGVGEQYLTWLPATQVSRRTD